MLLEGERILGLVKYNIVRFLLKYNVIIGKKLAYLFSKYEADDYAEKNSVFDLRKIPERIKKFIIYDEAIVKERFDECKVCEHFIAATSQCKKCGCFMRLKTKLSTSSCPVGKWGRVDKKDTNVVTATT